MKTRRFKIVFGGNVLRTMDVEAWPWDRENEAIARCLARLGLRPCRESDQGKRCPAGGGLHGHIPVERFFEEPPMVRGDMCHRFARLGDVTTVSYCFDEEHRIAPSVTFVEVT